jgi:hypothetical protein
MPRQKKHSSAIVQIPHLGVTRAGWQISNRNNRVQMVSGQLPVTSDAGFAAYSGGGSAIAATTATATATASTTAPTSTAAAGTSSATTAAAPTTTAAGGDASTAEVALMLFERRGCMARHH